MKWRFLTAIPLALLFLMLVAPGAFAESTDLKLSIAGKLDPSVGINTIWVIVAGSLVMFMQAGFAFLEIGFSRAKNAGTVVAKILTNFSIAAIGWWACGFAFAFGGPLGSFIGHDGGFFFTHLGANSVTAGGLTTFHPSFPVMDLSNATLESKWFFQFVFCAVSLAIVWGTTLERIKYERLHHLRDRLFDGHLPDRRPLGVRWRVPPERALARDLDRRHAGLRRFDRRPPDRRQRGVRRAAAARAQKGQVRARREAEGNTRAQHAAVRARGADPLARLVRVQPWIDAERT